MGCKSMLIITVFKYVSYVRCIFYQYNYTKEPKMIPGKYQYVLYQQPNSIENLASIPTYKTRCHRSHITLSPFEHHSSAFIICHVLAAAYIAEQGNQTSETEREDTTNQLVSDEPDEESMFRRTSST